MSRSMRKTAAGCLALALTVALAACSEKSTPAPTPVAQAPAPSSAPAPSPVATAPAPAVASTIASAPTASRQVPVNIQGVANAGLTVRVKNVELGEDATVLTVSVSFGNRSTNFTNLAETATFLVDAAGNRLMLRPPEDNRYVRINAGDTMEGKWVFLGAVPPSTTQVRLVINEGNAGDNTDGPGLTLTLPLQQGGS
ncbi:hypothetical protein [Variovorax sp. PAMC 28711]|uniref:hypothetical protein n=1 Tax=Variovorax sp. PAMC 28711 TaxID=1795631 RepID=UPI00078D369C|nr:hypothetical protein [Variovorax sp. PAMC 28711]AMM24589.1 hypothetical protein AX767_09690 [Variovorax sp. PAMC 28711]